MEKIQFLDPETNETVEFAALAKVFSELADEETKVSF